MTQLETARVRYLPRASLSEGYDLGSRQVLKTGTGSC